MANGYTIGIYDPSMQPPASVICARNTTYKNYVQLSCKSKYSSYQAVTNVSDIKLFCKI